MDELETDAGKRYDQVRAELYKAWEARMATRKAEEKEEALREAKQECPAPKQCVLGPQPHIHHRAVRAGRTEFKA